MQKFKRGVLIMVGANAVAVFVAAVSFALVGQTLAALCIIASILYLIGILVVMREVEEIKQKEVDYWTTRLLEERVARDLKARKE